MKLDLCGQWSLIDEQNNVFDAKVPGCVHTDLIEENLYWRDNYEKYQWIENCDWRYKKVFTLEEVRDNMVLAFEGLDTYCDIYLNGEKIGHGENMFITHKFSVDGHLQVGENELVVKFYSPMASVAEMKPRRAAFTKERINTRRMQCTYGWDWVARFLTCGICRPVYLTAEDEFAVEDLYIYTNAVDACGAEVFARGTYRNAGLGAEVTISVLDPAGKTVYARNIYVDTPDFAEYITIPHAELWYPVGYGAQPLYTLRMAYNGQQIDTKFGIRTVRVMEESDEEGSAFYQKCLEIKDTPSGLEYDFNNSVKGFTLLVNGVKILCMGANYVPTEPFVSEETPEKMTKLLETAKACGVNMIRVWGGGVFEKDFFYAECDRLGIMVIHDFLMACGQYPENEAWFIEHLKQETAFAAKLLRNHPCLMWWHGDNENAINGNDLDKEYRGRISAYEAMLPILNKLDYTRRFLPSSPYGGDHFASKTVGTTHNTQYLGSIFQYILDTEMKDYKEYFNTYTARFISEEPALGAVSKNSLLKMMTEEDIYEDGMAMWYHHTKSNPATKEILYYMLNFAEKVFGPFRDGKDRVFKLQYMQYEQVRLSMELCRKGDWFCSGIIYWMLNDCWPAAAGWALIDYYNYPKASYYSFKRAAKQVMASADTKGVVVSNRGLEDKTLTCKYRLVNFRTGEEKLLLEQTVQTIANRCVSISCPITLDSQQVAVFDLYEDGELYDRCFYKEGRLFMAPCQGVTCTAVGEGKVKVKAEGYVHAVELSGNYVFEDNYFILLPGQERIISYEVFDPEVPAEPVEAIGYTLEEEN